MIMIVPGLCGLVVIMVVRGFSRLFMIVIVLRLSGMRMIVMAGFIPMAVLLEGAALAEAKLDEAMSVDQFN
jgi:hypothetical protein